MTRSLLGLAVLIALPAWAQEPTADGPAPYETVVERPLDTTIPVSSSSLGLPEASGQSAVAPTAGTPEVTAYDAAMSNAQRSSSAASGVGAKEPLESVSPPPRAAVPLGLEPASDSPRAQAVAAKQVSAPLNGGADSANPAAPTETGTASLPETLAAAPLASSEATAALTVPVPLASPTPVASREPPSPFTAPAPLAVPASTSSPQARAFSPPGATQNAEVREQAGAANAEFHPAPALSIAKPTPSAAREQGRRSRREQRTVFGPRRHTRVVGVYGGGSLGTPGFGGPSSGAVEVGALIGGSLRLGAEFRGLSYGRSGPDVRLASSGFVIGWAFKTRAMIHPTADVVLGGGLVSHRDGDVIGGVGLTAVRGGAELNLTRSVRLTASVGWRGIAAPSREVRRDLNGLEGLVGIRVGWF